MIQINQLITCICSMTNIIYIPKLLVNGIEYHVFLEYQDDGSFALTVYGKNQ